MKRLSTKLLATILVIYLIVAAVVPFSVGAAPAKYSKEYNSGVRDEVCTTLDGTSASSYYTGSYTYDVLSEQSASALLSNLRTLMRSTHKNISSYDDCHYEADRTDCEGGDGSGISLIYTSYTATMGQWNGWNREHVWPKSKGGNNTTGGGADLHHIRPSDAGVNSSRGNKPYGYSNGGKEKYGTDPAVGYLGGTYNSTYFEPLDNVKGDVARICLYVYVRWGADWGATNITSVFQSVDVLLEWCEMDPVDTWEMGRNEVVQDIQGNRNVFIDYPEYAWLIFGEDVPDNITTPSGGAGTPSGGSGSGGNTGDEDETEGGGSTVTPPAVTITSISDIKAGTNKQYTTEGVVVGTNARSYLLSDGEDAILVYLNAAPGVSVGDKLRVTGTTSEYGGAKQFGQGTTHQKLGTEQVKYPTPILLDGDACDSYLSEVTVDYVKVVGTLSESGDYYNLDIDGATVIGSITYPANLSQLSPFVNKKVVVEGYVTGITGKSAKYLNIMMTDISEYTESTVCTHSSTKVVGKVNATCGAGGYTGDKVCASCGALIESGTQTQPTGDHSWGNWTSVSSTQERRECSVCHKTENRTVTPVTPPTPPVTCTHENTYLQGEIEPNCGNEGYSGDIYCSDCGAKIADGQPMSTIGYHEWSQWTAVDGELVRECSVCHSTESKACTHSATEIRGRESADCGNDGYSGDTYCVICGTKVADGEKILATGDHTFGKWTVDGDKQTRECSVCHKTEEKNYTCSHAVADVVNSKEATADEDGYTGDLACVECGKVFVEGKVIPKKGSDKAADTEGCGAVAFAPIGMMCLAVALATATVKKRK